MIYLLAISLALFVFLMAVIISTYLLKTRLAVEKRLVDMGMVQEQLKPVKIKREKSRTPVSQTLAFQLANAGIRMRTDEFLIMWAVSAGLLPVILALAGVHYVTVTAVLLAGLVLPPLYVRRKRKKRVLLFEKQLGDALVLIGNCLRAGMTFYQAMANVATEMPDPIGKEFARTIKEIQLGAGTEEALDHLAARVKSTDLLIMVSAVQIQRQVGGNLLDIIETISGTIKDRLKIKEDIRVMSATGRSSGAIVGVMPIVIGGILALINPEYIMTFFDTRAGVIMLITAACMEAAGFLIINRIVSIKY